MNARLLADTGERTFALIFDSGDSVVDRLEEFAREQGIHAARMTAIGAFRHATLGYYDIGKKEYRTRDFNEQLEVLSFLGDVARKEDGTVVVHVHVVLGRDDFTPLGGHLMEATVRPTLEVMLTEPPAHLRRQFDDASGLALIAP